MDGEFWFAVMCRAQKEQLARDDLRRRGFEVFWPYISEWVGTGHKAKSRLVKKRWLSRYLFVKTDRLGEVQDERARNMGVSTVVHATNNEPVPIQDLIIKELQDQADHLGEIYQGIAPKRGPNCKTGDVLRFTEETSPLFALYAEVKRVLDNGTVHALFRGELLGSKHIILSDSSVGEVVTDATTSATTTSAAQSGRAPPHKQVG